MGIDLPVIWAIIIGFGLMMYVVMDGFDLGIGILFPFIRDRGDRDTMVNTVAPVWDGNETWLVLGGAALMAAFPLAYSVLLSALYIPIFFMLGGPDLARRRFRIPLQGGRNAQAVLGQGLRLGLLHRDLLAGRRARRLHQRLQGDGGFLRRRQF